MKLQKVEEKYIKNNLYKLIIYFKLLHLITSTCNKSTPFLENDECISNCSYINLTKGICSLDNSIIKLQLLTDIISIGRLNFRYMSYAFNLDGDLVIIAPTNPSSYSRNFYGLKKMKKLFY